MTGDELEKLRAVIAAKVLGAYIISGEYREASAEKRYDIMIVDAIWMADKLIHELEKDK